jgi:hypothetical protein
MCPPIEDHFDAGEQKYSSAFFIGPGILHCKTNPSFVAAHNNADIT